MGFFHAFNQFIGNLDVFRAKSWKIHVICNSSKHNKRFCFEVFNKKLLINTEPSFNFWLTMKQNQKYFGEFPKISIFIWRSHRSEKSVPTLSFVGLKLENNCWFWSITIKNFWYCFFTNSADRAEILPRDTNFWRSMFIWDSQKLFLAGFLTYIGVSHTELCTTAYLSGDFLRRWWSSLFIELQNLCRIQTQFYLLQIVFCCKSNIDTFWIFCDILIRGIYLYQIIQIWFLF